MMKTVYRQLMMVVLLAGTVAGANAADPVDKEWQALKEKNTGRGCPVEQTDSVLGACRKRKLSAVEAGRLLEPVAAAAAEFLPADCLYARIEEGLAKNVEVVRIEAAVNKRLEFLRQARRIYSEINSRKNGHGPSGGPPRLIDNMAMALESGVDPEVLTSVFRRKGPMRYGRLAHIIEAAETLHLAGLDSDQLRLVMTDFLERNMNRQEMGRVLEMLQKGLAEGQSFDELYASVWDVKTDPEE